VRGERWGSSPATGALFLELWEVIWGRLSCLGPREKADAFYVDAHGWQSECET
jgi:hypothetical protein